MIELRWLGKSLQKPWINSRSLKNTLTNSFFTILMVEKEVLDDEATRVDVTAVDIPVSVADEGDNIVKLFRHYL